MSWPRILAESQGVWPRPRCASAQGDPERRRPDAIRSPVIRAPRAVFVRGVDVGATVDQALRRVGVAVFGRIVERRKTSGRGVEDERRIVPLLKVQEGNQRRGACTSSWILLEGFTDLLCFWGGFSGSRSLNRIQTVAQTKPSKNQESRMNQHASLDPTHPFSFEDLTPRPRPIRCTRKRFPGAPAPAAPKSRKDFGFLRERKNRGKKLA